MSRSEPRQDPQDKEFGAAAAEDQELVEQLEEEGYGEEDLSDMRLRHVRAAGKARPNKP